MIWLFTIFIASTGYKKIDDSEYQCPTKPDGYDDISNGVTSYNNVYACNANFDSNIRASKLLQLYNCKFNGIKALSGAPFFMNNFVNLGKQISIIEKCEFTKCEGPMGGAIYALIESTSFDVQLNIKDCKFENNVGSRGSGSIWFQGTHLLVENCQFQNNLGDGKGDEIFFEYPREAPENLKEDSIIIRNNIIKRTAAESDDSSLIYFSNFNTKFKFSFTKNRININTGGKIVYLFSCNENDKFTGTITDNFITSSNKENILDENFKGNQEAELDFDFDKDFQATPSIPQDQITPETSCSSFNFDDMNPTVINNRCVNDGKNDDTTFVDIIRSEFDHFTEKESGGAVHITNCGLKCKSATFKNCESSGGGGGAMYIKNTVQLSNNVDLEKLTFSGCKANFGGAIYAYSESEKNKVNIHSCIFRSNSLLGGGSDTENSGSAIYLTVKGGSVDNCEFYGDGKGSIVSVVNVFDGGKNSIVLSNVKKANLTFSRCNFDHANMAKSSIYYHSSFSGNRVLVVGCSFKGKLEKGSHYIESEMMKNDRDGFRIKSCKFELGRKSAAVFQFIDESEKRKSNDAFGFNSKYLLITVSFLSVLAVVSVFFFLRKKKISSAENENSENKSIEAIEESNN